MSSLPSSPRSPHSTDISSLLSGALPQDAEAGAGALLGQRLVHSGHLSQGQLTQALREQQQNRLRLGEICLEHGWVSPEVIYSEVSSQSVMLGELLIACKDISFDQLRVALAQQRRFGRQLGEILVWKGWVSPERLGQMLEIQQQLRESSPYPAWEAMQALTEDSEMAAVPAPQESIPPDQELDLLEFPPVEDKHPFADPVVAESEEDLEALAEVFPELSRPQPAGIGAAQGGAGEAEAVEAADPQQQRIAELEGQLRQRDQEWDGLVAEMNQQIESFQQQYQTRIAKLEAQIREHQSQLRQAQQEAQSTPSPDQLEHLQAQLRSAQDQRDRHQHRHQQERDQLQQQLQALQQERDHQQAQIQALEQEIEAHRSQTQASQDQIQNLEEQISQAAAAQPQHHQREQELTRRIQALQEQLNPLQGELVAAQTAAVEHQGRADQLSQELEQMQAQLPEAQQQLQQAQERIQTLEAEAQQAQITLADLQGQLQQARSRPQPAPPQSASQQQEAQDLHQAHQHYQILVEKQQTQLEASQVRVTELTQHLAEARHQLREAHGALYSQHNQGDQTAQRLTALQLQITQVEQRNQALTQELEQSQILLATYRQRLDTPPPPTDPPASDPHASDPTPETKPASPSPQQTAPDPSRERSPDTPIPQGVMPVLTPWAQNLFFQLQEAGLLSDAQMDQVLLTWQQRGGKLIQVLSDCTGLTSKTVGFFSDGGYSARVSGYERIGEFLKAADLVTEEQIQEVIRQRPSDQPLVQALVDQGLLHPVTADYFIRHFVQST